MTEHTCRRPLSHALHPAERSQGPCRRETKAKRRGRRRPYAESAAPRSRGWRCHGKTDEASARRLPTQRPRTPAPHLGGSDDWSASRCTKTPLSNREKASRDRLEATGGHVRHRERNFLRKAKSGAKPTATMSHPPFGNFSGGGCLDARRSSSRITTRSPAERRDVTDREASRDRSARAGGRSRRRRAAALRRLRAPRPAGRLPRQGGDSLSTSASGASSFGRHARPSFTMKVSVAVGLVPDLPTEARVRADVLQVNLEPAPGCRAVLPESAVAVE